MAVTRTDVTARFAEFVSIADAEFTAVLGDAALEINPTAWGTRANLGTIYLTAHLLGCAHPSLIPSGRVVREAMDGTEYMYQVPQLVPAADDYDSTPYGRMYKALLRKLPGARWATT